MNEKALEMARSAAINLDNMVKMMPALAAHPLLPTVRMQIRECTKALETEQSQLAGLRAQYDGSQRQLTAVMAEHTETVAELASRTASEKLLLDALDDVINQACGQGDLVDSMALSAYADAMRLLAEYGRLVILTDSGRRVIAVRQVPAAQENQHD